MKPTSFSRSYKTVNCFSGGANVPYPTTGEKLARGAAFSRCYYYYFPAKKIPQCGNE
jgi:hypothetical protein